MTSSLTVRDLVVAEHHGRLAVVTLPNGRTLTGRLAWQHEVGLFRPRKEWHVLRRSGSYSLAFARSAHVRLIPKENTTS